MDDDQADVNDDEVSESELAEPGRSTGRRRDALNWNALVGALAALFGALVGSATAVMISVRQSDVEDRAALRERRQVAYADVVTTADAYLQELLVYEQIANQPLPADLARVDAALEEFRQDVNLVRLLGSEPVRDQAMEACESLAQVRREAERGQISDDDHTDATFAVGLLVEAARDELD